MARLAVISMFGVLLSIGAGRAHAAEEAEELVKLAAEAGIEDVALLVGAMASQPGVDPRGYLIFDGLLQPPVPPLVGAVARADCIIEKESHGLDVPNRQGSGASGPGQYFPGTWASHTGLYRGATGYSGSLSLHSLPDVRRVMSYVLWAYPHMRSAWTVSGC